MPRCLPQAAENDVSAVRPEQQLAMAVIERALRDYLDPGAAGMRQGYCYKNQKPKPGGRCQCEEHLSDYTTACGFLYGSVDWDLLVEEGKAWSLSKWCETFGLCESSVHKIIAECLRDPSKLPGQRPKRRKQ